MAHAAAAGSCRLNSNSANAMTRLGEFMLQEFIGVNRDEIIRRCRAKVSARPGPAPARADVDYGVPVFLGQLVEALREGTASTLAISNSALRHGHDLLLQGFTVSQVVHAYGDVCQSITELALETNAPISVDDFRTLNRCLDDAIAGAVTEYGRGRHQSTLDGEAAREQRRQGYFAHELGNLINTGLIAFEILKAGDVGLGGSTGAVLQRSLMGLRTLVSRSIAEIRLSENIQNKETFAVAGFLEEVGPAAVMEGVARGVTLTIPLVEADVTILADRQVLAAVVANLVQNAFKFTAPGTTVTLRAAASGGRVLIEVQDQCGGLPPGDADGLFRPFEQRNANRTGLGLGLAFCRTAVEANDGLISARSLPGEGCVFAIDLPRAPALATTAV
jgi:signal transduction histidine kinase